MPTELNLADGRSILVTEPFDAVLEGARRGNQLFELTPYEAPSEVKRHGYEDLDSAKERIAVNPAHVVSIRTAE